jgi:hypothetical protein
VRARHFSILASLIFEQDKLNVAAHCCGNADHALNAVDGCEALIRREKVDRSRGRRVAATPQSRVECRRRGSRAKCPLSCRDCPLQWVRRRPDRATRRTSGFLVSLAQSGPSPIRPKGKLRIVLLTAGGLASHLIGRLVLSQPDVNRVPQ